MVPRLAAELGRVIRYALDDTKRTVRFCLIVMAVAVAAGVGFAVYAQLKP